MDKLDVVLLVGRPAAGKSEVIDFLTRLDDAERLREYHLGPFVVLDDFVYVWETFENDGIRAHMGLPRRDTDAGLYFLDDRIWDFYIERVDLDLRKLLARDPHELEAGSVLMEFARGGAAAYAGAFQHLSDDVLARACVLYVDVSFEESLRKNRRRFRPGQEDSILYHSLEDAKMERYYRTDDWQDLTGGRDEGYLTIRSHRVPFAVFHNEPEKTLDPALLGPALREATGTLMQLFKPQG